MEAKKFEKQLLEALSQLTEPQITNIRKVVKLDEDYEIDQYGMTHIVKKNLDTKHNH